MSEDYAKYDSGWFLDLYDIYVKLAMERLMPDLLSVARSSEYLDAPDVFFVAMRPLAHTVARRRIIAEYEYDIGSLDNEGSHLELISIWDFISRARQSKRGPKVKWTRERLLELAADFHRENLSIQAYIDLYGNERWGSLSKRTLNKARKLAKP